MPAVQAGARVSGHPHADVELAFGVVPAAGADQHAAVVDAAFGVQERAAVGLDEAVGDPAPLGGPLGVARQRAGREHVAARVHDGLEVGWFAAEGRGHRLVDLRQTAGDGPLPNTE